jgi:transcriptional regulator with GAF, ATPase, and Fis domain
MRARLLADAGDAAAAERDRHAALELIEQIASELPRDLREVYWNDPRRRALQQEPPTKLASGSPRTTIVPSSTETGASATAQTHLGAPVREDRLGRVLEINRAIAGEYDLDRLLDKVTDHAIALLSAERGFVLLRSRSGEDKLSIHAARDRDGADPHARFSQSIAERVVATGEPFVAVDAGQDDRVSDYVSVHQLMLKSVACVPIRARRGDATGALYLETRMRPAALFDEEIPTLTALADQVAIAIETARLVGENLQRAAELEEANRELEAARVKLKAALGRRTEQLASTRRDLQSARQVIHSHFGYHGIVGKSASMRRVFAIIDRVKDTDVPVLLTGESGTGKEVIARAIHQAGPRGKQRFVGVNCGAIPEHLLESELFGHVRGAFTGADRDSRGLFRELTDGTILLDEIGEMPQKMQAGLLRVLQEKVVRPVGGTKEERVNTRVVTATHRNLEEMVASSTFREDLYYRLNVIEIRVPPLRERIDDIPLLIDHFLRLFAARYDRPKRPVAREAVKRLMGLAWPGNVRQLENVLLNAWILSDREELELDDFELPHDLPPAPNRAKPAIPKPASLDERTEQEREQILAALAECNWNRARAAKQIGMPRRTFYRRLKKYGIQ